MKDHSKDLEKRLSENQESEQANIVQAMNEKYLGAPGRLGFSDPVSKERWTNHQKQFGAEYALTLLDGFYINPETNEKKEFPQDNQLILERVLLASMDLFENGHNFLYHSDSVIDDSTRKAIGRKIIEIVQNTEFTEEDYISRGLFVLTPGGIGSYIYRQLESVKGTWFEEPYVVPYNSEDTKKIIRELVPLIKGRFAE